jgi:hypothetical protein
MPPTGFTYAFDAAPAREASATLEIKSGQGGDPIISLQLSPRHPLSVRQEVLQEYQNLSAVLGNEAKVHVDFTGIEIGTGGKSPAAHTMFIIGDLDGRGLISEPSAQEAVKKILAFEEQPHAAEHEVSQSMQDAITSVRKQDAAAGLKQHGGQAAAHEGNVSSGVTGSKGSGVERG